MSERERERDRGHIKNIQTESLCQGKYVLPDRKEYTVCNFIMLDSSFPLRLANALAIFLFLHKQAETFTT